MAIDVFREEVLTFAAARKLLPCRRGGKKPNLATFYRWAKVGCRGVRLETVQVGGVCCTSKEALQRFFDSLTAAASPGCSHPPAGRERQIAAANRELDALGL